MSQEVATMAANGTLALSPHERVPFTPEHYVTDGSPAEGAFTYALRPLRNKDRLQVALAVRARLGNFVAVHEVRDAMREAAVECLAADEAATACALLDELDELGDVTTEDEAIKARLADMQRDVGRLENRLSRLHPPLAELLTFDSRQTLAFKELTARACIMAWDGPLAPCRRKDGFVTEEAMLAVPDADVTALENRCLELKEVTADLDRGSAAP